MPDTRPGIKFVRLSDFEKAHGAAALNSLNLAKTDKTQMGGGVWFK